MGQELQVPDAFKAKGMAKVFQGRVNLDDNLADGIGQSYPIIRIKGKIWSIQHRGERKIVSRPDDGSPSGHLDVVILEQAKGKSKSYYKKYDAGTSDGDRPICASIDGIVPDDDVQAKQNDTCALCQRNVWKTDPETGRRGRECTDYKRLAVLVMPNQTTPLFGQALLEPMFLRVPPDSLQSLAIMGETMTNQGYHYKTYLTRISFDPQKAHPSMLFRPVRPLDENEGAVVLEVSDNPSIGRIVGTDVATGGMKTVSTAAEPTGLNTVTATVTKPRPVAVAKPKPAPEPEPEPEEEQLSLLTPPPAAVPVKKPPRAARVVPAAPPAAAAPQNNGHAEEDVDLAVASDDDLDAEIAKLIATK